MGGGVAVRPYRHRLHGPRVQKDSNGSVNNIGWYRQTFTLPSGYAGQAVWIEFDGVYRNCLVWFNGHILGRNVSGYASFQFDVTPYINPGGTNVLVVRVDASRDEGWFYEGAGIYRHVWLVAADPVHVAHWGTFVATTVPGGIQRDRHRFRPTSPIKAARPRNGSLTSTILDANTMR